MKSFLRSSAADGGGGGEAQWIANTHGGGSRMIISRTPLRMSFAGGGSDLPAFYRREPGAVLSTAIDKYVYISVNPKFDGGIRLAYSQAEEVERLQDIQHRLFRAVFEMLQIAGGVEVTSTADIPSRGTGLGSSSAFTVGLLNVMAAYLGRHVSPDELAARACEVEIDRCGEPIGKQDQYASAFGGLNFIEFLPDETVRVSPVIMPLGARRRLESELIVFYTGGVRSASAILQAQSQKLVEDEGAMRGTRRLVELAHRLRSELASGSLDEFGQILRESWSIKKRLASGISNPAIEDWHDAAIAAGASGGKLLGAGAGGFLMFHAPQERHDAIAQAVRLRRVQFRFESAGARILFSDSREL